MSGGQRPGGWDLVARPRKARWAAWAGAVLVLAAMVAVAALLRTVPTGVHFRFADQVAMVLLGLLMAGGLLMFTRPRVRAGAAGVEVRNVVNSRTYRWDEVLGFGFPDRSTWGRVELPDDEYVPLLAIQVVDGERAVAAMRRLRELHAEYDPAPEGTDADAADHGADRAVDREADRAADHGVDRGVDRGAAADGGR